jgi:hypothetical protein
MKPSKILINYSHITCAKSCCPQVLLLQYRLELLLGHIPLSNNNARHYYKPPETHENKINK